MNPLKSIAAVVDRLRPYRVFDRPIFIIAAPRSGSSFLFELLSCFDETWGWHAEVDDIWWKYFPYERLEEPSDYVGAEELTPEIARGLRRDFYRHALWARQEQGRTTGPGQRLGLHRVRYLDKTISNCFHLGVLKRLFPKALYIHLVRDGRATVSSMMEGWQDPVRFTKPALQHFLPADSTVDYWAYPAPPGWRKVLDRPLEEICAWSWMRHVITADEGLGEIPEAHKRLVKYEDLAADPEALLRRLAAFAGMTWTESAASYLARPPLSRTTVSAPEPDKWRRLHGARIQQVLPTISPILKKFDYAC
jgi:hypothetical protein